MTVEELNMAPPGSGGPPDEIVEKARRAVRSKPRKYVRLSDLLAVVERESHYVSYFNQTDHLYRANLRAATQISGQTEADINAAMHISKGPNSGRIEKFRCEPSMWNKVKNAKWHLSTKLMASCSFGLGQKLMYYYVDRSAGEEGIIRQLESFKESEDVQLLQCADDIEFWFRKANGNREKGLSGYNSGSVEHVTEYGRAVAARAEEMQKQYPSVNASDLQLGFDALNALSVEEYSEHLSKLTSNAAVENGQPNLDLYRLARLVGVAMKEPFATPIPADPTVSKSRALRAWNLLPGTIENPANASTWQYHALESMAETHGMTPSQLANDAQNEKSFFDYLMMSCANYICGRGDLRKNIDDQLAKLPKDDAGKTDLSTQVLFGAAGLSLANALVTAIPILGTALGASGGPIVFGMMIIIANIGTDAFCNWRGDVEHHVPLRE